MISEKIKKFTDETEMLKKDFYGLVYEIVHYKLQADEDYLELETEINKINDDYRNVVSIIEDFEVKNREYTHEEIEKIAEFIKIMTRLHDLELEAFYKKGFKDAFQLLRETEVI